MIIKNLPWKVLCDQKDGFDICHISDKSGLVIAQNVDPKDAYLIAAGPGLYRACLSLVKAYDRKHTLNNHIHKLEQEIAKAETKHTYIYKV